MSGTSLNLQHTRYQIKSVSAVLRPAQVPMGKPLMGKMACNFVSHAVNVTGLMLLQRSKCLHSSFVCRAAACWDRSVALWITMRGWRCAIMESILGSQPFWRQDGPLHPQLGVRDKPVRGEGAVVSLVREKPRGMSCSLWRLIMDTKQYK